MAKKDENKNKGEEAKKTTRGAKKGSTPKKSGDVKGPTGVGGKKKADDRAVEKEPAKINQPAKGRFSDKDEDGSGENLQASAEEKDKGKTKKPATGKAKKASKKAESEKLEAADDVKKLPKPKKKLPKKTTSSEEKTVSPTKASGKKSTTEKPIKKTSVGKKPAKFKSKVVDEEVDPDYVKSDQPIGDNISGEDASDISKGKTFKPKSSEAKSKEDFSKMKKSTEKKAKTASDASAKASKAKKSAKTSAETEETAKKMAGKRATEESETNKKEDDELSFSDLKNMAKNTAKEMAENFLPDEETQKELGDMAKSILPDKDSVKETAKKVAKKAAEKGKEAAENISEAKNAAKESAKDKAEAASEAKKTTKKTAKKTAEEASPFSKTKETEKDKNVHPETASLISEFDVHLFREGKHYHLYKKMGAHVMDFLGTKGVYFAVWAPNAQQVSVIGNFNGWDRQAHPMKVREDGSGIWEAFIPDAQNGSLYKYLIRSTNGYEAEKGDPFAFMWETPPNTASVVWDLENDWGDEAWMKSRKAEAENPKPMSVYELHLGSWRRVPEEDNRSLSYRELAEQLPAYLNEMGFTHVEFMPIMEHPFFGSWGYQITGYFAPSSRFGSPQDFMYLIQRLHEAGIGVILDWVPSHFPSDLHGLHYFDGTHLYEHEDKRKGFHPDWQSYIFNYGRNEVRSFLISNALFWLDKFHADGLRVDAVASMLYLDYSRKEGEWIPNEQGGNENLEAISFLKEFNEVVYSEFPDAVTIAEESTAWPMVSKPTYMGGLGFGQKWMMGWMHDTLEYFKNDPIHRKHHQNMITFSTTYAFTENFMLPLSHDEVVYGKQSILNKMPGDEWNKFANLRSLYSYMYAHPGTKLLFMGAEFAQESEWGHDYSLEWHLTENPRHSQIQETLKALNKIYTTEPAFYERAFESSGFEWVDINDAENSVISFLRKGENPQDTVLVVCNLTPVPRENYRIGVPEAGTWNEIFNSDAEEFGGSNIRNNSGVNSEAVGTHGKDNSVSLTLPPMGVVYLKRS